MIPTAEEVAATWDAYADAYSKRSEKNSLVFAISLASMLQFFEEKPETILELGCGSGLFSRHLSQIVEHECSLTSIDISEDMISLAKAFSNKYPPLPHIKITYEVGNAEDLSQFHDESFDAYIANLCLHLAGDPKKMLHELKRVLKPGRRFGVSVLGPSERVTMISNVAGVIEELSKEIPALKPSKEMRSYFYLSKREDLIKLVEESGLEVDYCWYQPGPFNCITVEDYKNYILQTPNYKDQIEKLNENEKRRLLEAIEQSFKKTFVDKKVPSMKASLLLVGRKP